MGASRWQVLRHVIFPHMIPSFFAGMRLGMTGVLLGVLLAELYVSTAGIGYFTTLFTQNFDPTRAARPDLGARGHGDRAQRDRAPGRGPFRPLARRLRGISMAEKLRLTVACGDYEIVRALKEGTVEADGIDLVMLTGMGPRERHWRMARKAEFDVCEANVGAYFMARDHGRAAHGDPGVPAPALPARLRVRQRRRRHSRAEGPDRQEGRRHQFPARLQHLDARHSGGGVRPAAPAGDLGGRAQRGRGLHAAEGPSHRDDRAGQEARRHAGGGRNPGHAVAGRCRACSSPATSGSCVCFPTTRTSSSTISARPASFRSCT